MANQGYSGINKPDLNQTHHVALLLKKISLSNRVLQLDKPITLRHLTKEDLFVCQKKAA